LALKFNKRKLALLGRFKCLIPFIDSVGAYFLLGHSVMQKRSLERQLCQNVVLAKSSHISDDATRHWSSTIGEVFDPHLKKCGTGRGQHWCRQLWGTGTRAPPPELAHVHQLGNFYLRIQLQ